jgi:hypothetical protein
MPTLSEHIALMKTLAAMPVARLRFERHLEPVNVLATYRQYTRRHPKYKIIQHKSWGAALIDLRACATRAGYLDLIKGKNNGAYHAKRARARGYHLLEIDRNDHVDAIHDINTSIEQRQGRPMDARYQEKQLHFEAPDNFRCYGVFSAEHKLAAYATFGRFGNFSGFSQLMGYRNNDGIMHLMVSEIAALLIEEGEVDFLMYDTFFGALPGLQQFKTILGFQPYRALYSLQ